MSHKISACILTYNCADKVERLLKSLDFVDEIVVVDGGKDHGSIDGTLDVVKNYTDKVYHKKFLNSGEQRNFCAEKASNDWVLALDSDEVVSKELKAEIVKTSEQDKYDGYYLPRVTFFSNQPINHGGWYPDYAIRLYDKQIMKFKNSKVHEKVIPKGEVGYFKSPLLHYSYASVKDYMGRFKRYSAMQVENENVPVGHINLFWMIAKPLYRFINMYVVKLGILDGWRGLFLAVMSGAYDFRVHYLAEKKVLIK